jgi:hypothetical protein
MDGKRWIVVYGKYEGLQKRALNLINGAVFDLYKDYISFYKADEVCEELVKENNLIILGSVEDNCIIKEFIDKNGRLDLERSGGVLGYVHGHYFNLGECIGHFGFSVRKKAGSIVRK